MFVETNGTRLYYEMEGSGTPLILLHGNGEDHTIFAPSIRILREHFTVYAIDTRGHGESEESDDIHYRTFMEDIRGFIDALSVRKPIICGFSDGAITALMLAFTYPDIPRSIISSGANTTPDGLIEEMQEEIRKCYEATEDTLLRLMLEEPSITPEELGKITCPVLVTAGEHDAVKLDDTRLIARSIPRSRLLILSGEDHASYIAGSEKIARLILSEASFLQSDLV